MSKHADRGPDQQGAEHDKQATERQATPTRAMDLLVNGGMAPEQIAQTIKAHPDATREIIALLHDRFGNSFVNQVMACVHGGAIAPSTAAVAPADDPAFDAIQEAVFAADGATEHAAPKKTGSWVDRAIEYNREHPEYVEGFMDATAGSCIDYETAEPDPRKVARWQAENGLPPDGRIGLKTFTLSITNAT